MNLARREAGGNDQNDDPVDAIAKDLAGKDHPTMRRAVALQMVQVEIRRCSAPQMKRWGESGGFSDCHWFQLPSHHRFEPRKDKQKEINKWLEKRRRMYWYQQTKQWKIIEANRTLQDRVPFLVKR
jgi:hypothetical protein